MMFTADAGTCCIDVCCAQLLVISRTHW